MKANGLPRISVVMPVYNEMATIEEILLRVQAVELDKEIVIVDDGSVDGTRAFLTKRVDSRSLCPPHLAMSAAAGVTK